ncbi:MAG: hypothetical protein RQ752_07345 [Thermohalobaculum sp.]|nr:hypothetical protein [Thermohalobaculum sp.]
MNDKNTDMDRLLDDALDRLAAAEAGAAPVPDVALVARVLADAKAVTAAATATAARAALPHASAMRSDPVGRGVEGRGAGRLGGRGGRDAGTGRGIARRSGPVAAIAARWLAGGAGAAAAAMVAGLVVGFLTGLTGPEPEILTAAMPAGDDVIVVADAGLALFGADSPF